MAMFAPIPLPGIDNPQFKDVMDYLEQLRQNKINQANLNAKQQLEKSQFAQNKDLERQKMEELAKYHQQLLNQNQSLNPLKMELLKNKIESLKNGSNPSIQDKETEKLNAKRLDDIEKESSELSSSMSNAVDASTILEKNHSATGYGAATKNYIGKGSQETGELNDIFGSMQANLAKDYGKRGSVYGTKLAGNRKPALKNDYEQNIGALNQIHKDYYRRYKLMEKDYKRLSGGKELPISLNNFYNKVRVRSPKGDEVIKNPEEASALIQKYPGSEIIGNAYE